MKFKTELLPHQKKAVEKLQHIRVGALYMEMGTGKTRTAFELIAERLNVGKVVQVLWLCPCTVKSAIRDEIRFHIEDGMEVFRIAGIESLSQSDRLYFKLLDYVAAAPTFLVVDESNLVKNHFAKRTRRIQALSEVCPYRLMLNGTPISKNEADLFAQWYILDKRILGYNSFWSFAANHIEYDEYGKPRRCLNVDYLSRKIAPYTYSVTKEECNLKLPEKSSIIESFYLTETQMIHYDMVKQDLLGQVNEFDSTTIYRLFTGLQLICSGKRITNLSPLRSVLFFDNPFDNPRVQMLLKIIENCHDEKIIIWHKFKHEIDEVRAVLKEIYGSGSIAEMHGSIRQKDRHGQIELFRTKARFLLAHKTCGGYGLNLQFSSRAIYYSNDFNWATRAQSEDRIHRIGQQNKVKLTDIYACNKVDMRILRNLWRKENLADMFKSELKKNRNMSDWIDCVGEDDDDTNRIEPERKAICTR